VQKRGGNVGFSIGDFIFPILLLIVLLIVRKSAVQLPSIPFEFLNLPIAALLIAILALAVKVKDMVFIGFNGFKPVFIRLTTPIVITGVTGTGKTCFTKYLIKKLMKKFKIIVFDWNNEYSNVLLSTTVNVGNYKFRILNRRDAVEARDLIAASLNLTDPQTNLLGKILTSLIGSEVYVRDLVKHISKYPVDDSATLTVREALLRKISPFIGDEDAFNPQDIDDGAIVIDGGEVERKIGYALILKDIWQRRVREGRRENFDTILIIEEAHNLVPCTDNLEFNVFERWILEIRKYGVITILVSPSISLLSNVVSANTSMYINFTEPRKAKIKLYGKELNISIPFYKDEVNIEPIS
jgi:DNA helicase HerA-like ATPase